MTSEDKPRSRSEKLATKLMFAALTTLQEAGGSLPIRELLTRVEKRVSLTEWDLGVYEKSGYIRWHSIMHFYSIDFSKSGFLVKKGGVWYLTPDGEEALKQGEAGLFQAARAGYIKWAQERKKQDSPSTAEDGDINSQQELTIEEMEQRAQLGLQAFVNNKNPYEFQDLVAALLRGMGYYTPFIAPRGKDGGVDVIAYRDPLGTVSPRIKVQVKHRPDNPVNVQEVRQLMGILQKDGDVGMIVSSGGFTSDAKATALNSHVHIEMVDFDRFSNLWQEFYPRLSDEDKNRLPLKPVYFLAPQE
jgi:restriction system protein